MWLPISRPSSTTRTQQPAPQHPEPIGEEAARDLWRRGLRALPRNAYRSNQQNSPVTVEISYRTADQSPQLAEYVEDIEILRVSADTDMALFLKILALINSAPSAQKPRISLPAGRPHQDPAGATATQNPGRQ